MRVQVVDRRVPCTLCRHDDHLVLVSISALIIISASEILWIVASIEEDQLLKPI